jgi:hypothetical protein
MEYGSPEFDNGDAASARNSLEITAKGRVISCRLVVQ